jgi:hypothetical protein
MHGKVITNDFKADRGDRIRRTPYERTALVQPVKTVADQPHWLLRRSRGDCLPPLGLPLSDLVRTVGPYDVYRTSLWVSGPPLSLCAQVRSRRRMGAMIAAVPCHA